MKTKVLMNKLFSSIDFAAAVFVSANSLGGSGGTVDRIERTVSFGGNGGVFAHSGEAHRGNDSVM